jgi:hypothetical protein
MDLWSGLIGAVIGGLLTIAGAWAQAAYYRRDRRAHLKASLAAEISSLVALARVNQYDAYLRQNADLAEALPAGTTPEAVVIPADHNYFSVFEASAAEIGLLDARLAARIIGFYQATRSWLDTVSRPNAGDMQALTGEQAAWLYRRLADRICALATFGDSLVTDLGGHQTIGDEIAKVTAVMK